MGEGGDNYGKLRAHGSGGGGGGGSTTGQVSCSKHDRDLAGNWL